MFTHIKGIVLQQWVLRTNGIFLATQETRYSCYLPHNAQDKLVCVCVCEHVYAISPYLHTHNLMSLCIHSLPTLQHMYIVSDQKYQHSQALKMCFCMHNHIVYTCTSICVNTCIKAHTCAYTCVCYRQEIRKSC